MHDDATHALDEAAQVAAGLPPRIGPYAVIGLLGEGAMGRVYLARQAHPRREVALKVVRGISTAALDRFRREIDLLAQLEHPGIVRLYAAGEDEVGGLPSPWFALEVVRGPDLQGYLGDANPDLRTRIALLARLARAVDYAHQRGIIHRDLKPSNILVDEHGQPKILDFGIARLHGEEGGQMTQAGQVMGTLPYMSPEQLAGNARDVDARSDVYALGAIGYEMFSGRIPHPKLSTSSLFEAVQIIQREDPEPLARLNRAARGDLELVVMKALAADPARRYASAAALADDLDALLASRPVQARAPTWTYRSGRFVRRHRALTVSATAIFLALLAATAVSLRAAQQARAALAQAEVRAQEVVAVNRFLETMLTSAMPEEAKGHQVKVTEVLDQAERQLGTLQAPPAVRLSVASTLADMRLAMGEFERGLALNRTALSLVDAAGEGPVRRGTLLRQRTSLLAELDRNDEAREAAAQAQRLLANAPPADRIAMDLVAAWLKEESGSIESGQAGYRAVIADATAAMQADDHPELQRIVESARNNLAGSLRANGHLDEAEAIARELLATRRARYGESDPRTLASRQKLAMIYSERGDFAAAEAEAKATLALLEQVFGPESMTTLVTRQTLSATLLQEGKVDEAEPHARAVLAAYERQLGPRHTQTVSALGALGYLLEERKQYAEAEALYRRVVAIQADNPAAVMGPRNNLAMLMLKRGDAAGALQEFDRLLAVAGKVLGKDHAYWWVFSGNRGLALLRAGRLDEARAALESAHAALKERLGPEHQRTRTLAERLAETYAALGLTARAARMRDEAKAAAPAPAGND